MRPSGGRDELLICCWLLSEENQLQSSQRGRGDGEVADEMDRTGGHLQIELLSGDGSHSSASSVR